MNSKQLELCKRCLIVSVHDSSLRYEILRAYFLTSVDARQLTSPGVSSTDTWIILFSNSTEADKYIGKEIEIEKVKVVPRKCECPCDVPQEWTQTTNFPFSPWNHHGGLPPGYGFPYCPMPGYPYGCVPPPNFRPEKELLELLNNMGIPKEDSIKGLYFTGNRSVESAAEWIFNNQDNLKQPQPPPFSLQPQGYNPQIGHQAFNVHADSSSSRVQLEQKGTRKTSESVTEQEIKITRSYSDTPKNQKVNEEQPEQSNMLKVTNLPDQTTEESLTLFFENTRRSGGGDVEACKIEVDTNGVTAIITFKEVNVVESVLKKSPLLFMNTKIEVERYTNEPKHQNEPPIHNTQITSAETTDSMTVEVRGVEPQTQQLTVQYYFESKKGANEDVDNIEYIEEENVYRITFSSDEAVEKVISKTHTIEGQRLQVKKYTPPPTYTNKILVKGLPSPVTEDDLTNYMESRLRQDVLRIEFSTKFKDTAVVTFEDDIDLLRAQEACAKKTFQQKHLTLHHVVVSNCILVTGFSDKTTESSLEYYFDNKRRSGVEHVDEAKMEDNFCLIFFQNPEDAETACRRSHTIDQSTINVQMYYECLGPPFQEKNDEEELENEETNINVEIDSIYVEDIDSDKLKLLIRSTKLRNLIEKEMERVHARVTWPSSEYGYICLERIKEKSWYGSESKDRAQWDAVANRQIKECLDGFRVEHHSSFRDIWVDVKSAISVLHYSEVSDVDVFLVDDTCEIHIGGKEDATKKLSNGVKQILDDQQRMFQQENEKIEERLQLQDYQQRMLEALQFSSSMSSLYRDVEIAFLVGEPGLKLRGSISDIQDIKSKMLEQITKIQHHTIGPFSENYVQFIKDTDVRTMIDNEIKSSGNICAWGLVQDSIDVYTMSHVESMNVRRIFHENIKESGIPIDKDNKPILESRDWRKFRESLQRESRDQGYYTRIQEQENNSVSVVSTSKDELGNVVEKIRDFMFENNISDQTLPFTKHQMKTLKERYRDKIDLVSLKLKGTKVKLKFDHSSITITGNKKARKVAMQELEPIFKVLKQNASKDDIKPFVPFGLGHGSVVESFNTEEGQSIMVLCCDITDLGVDVIVSPADHQLSCSGGLSRMVVEEGGQTILDQCREFRRQNGPLAEGEVFTSRPGKLKCKAIIHAVGPVLHRSQTKEDKVLKTCIHAVLHEMDGNRYESLAIPALCCGAGNYPVHEAVETIVGAVEQYFRNSDSSIKSVYFCDVAAKVTDLFVLACTRIFKRANQVPLNQYPSQRAGSVATPVPQIRVVIQDLAKMKVNVIVNTTSTDLRLDKSGAVSSSLLKVGGIGIQQECQRSYPSGIKYGKVAITSGGQLQCTQVYHGALPQYERDGSSLKILRQFVNQCLLTIQGYNYTSIAFPSMGTGQLSYPPGQVADVMFDTVAQYYQSYPGHNPQEVYFCLYHRDFTTVKAFQDEEERRKPKQSSRRKDRL